MENNVLTLLRTSGIGKRTVDYILKSEYRQNLYDSLTPYDLLEILVLLARGNSNIRIPSIQDLKEGREDAIRIIEQSYDYDIHIITQESHKYPQMYLSLKDAPILLYVKGNIEALNYPKSVAIIGTREPSPKGFFEGENISEYFTEYNYTIVSGLAVGCDTSAHKGCLRKNGTTIAVMPCGLDRVYPKKNELLAIDIIESDGTLISEYPIGESPRNNYFVERDRLQSGLSQGIIVIETGVIGGTMHTVKFAIEQKRHIACLASHLSSLGGYPQIEGNIKLISDGIAKPLQNRDDLISFMHLMQGKISSEIYDIDSKNNLRKYDKSQFNLF